MLGEVGKGATALRRRTFSVRPMYGRHFGSQKDCNQNQNLDLYRQNRSKSIVNSTVQIAPTLTVSGKCCGT